MATVKCDNCDFQGPESKVTVPLEACDDLGERLDPGSEVPYGDCPMCGAFVYLVRPDRETREVDALEKINLAAGNIRHYLHAGNLSAADTGASRIETLAKTALGRVEERHGA